jgi:multidrug efflux pump subunit AcrA (membrane-fusion protein)
MKLDIETRIADAFDAQLSSKQLSALLVEVAQADQDAKLASEKANETALDPATRPDAVAKARKDMEDADFRRLRMERATAKLTELRDGALEREKSEARSAEQAAAIIERDQLVKDLEEYAILAPKIATLLSRLQANNNRLEKTGGWIDRAEPIARHADQSIVHTHDSRLPGLLMGVKLPKFRKDGTIHGYLWPQQ